MYLMHYGTPRHSGRYPWGSGEDPYQSSKGFMGYVSGLRKKGMSEVEIAKGLGMTTSELRAKKTLARNQILRQETAEALRLKEKGMSNSEIARRLGKNESSVRNLLKDAMSDKLQVTNATADTLKAGIDKNGLIDIGSGVEAQMGISRTKLKASIELLKQEGYTVHEIYIEQVGGSGQKTTMLVLAPPGMTYSEVYKNRYKIGGVDKYTEDGGRTWTDIKPPVSLDPKRVKIQYAEDGGIDKDGVIELRRGTPDLSLGDARYAQVRIKVGDSLYLKGMAMYSDDLPDGVDVQFNTNKKKGTPFEKVLKTISDDPDSPFGARITRQKTWVDADGKPHQSPINIVNEEGVWATWSRNLPSQFLSKQRPSFAKKQLSTTLADMQKEFGEIMKLTNPTVRKKLLEDFAEGLDSAAVHLKAAAMPRQATHVLLPFPELKKTEVYAPNYKNGEKVVLVRFPHGGIFEIPELTVNNNNQKARSLIGKALDAIGIHPKVAEQLSGADFDGDTVLVIPNPKGEIKTSSPLTGLKNFDPKAMYSMPDDAPRMNSRTKGIEMGKVSNLITDMTIKGASIDEICRAVRHSMVVIDAEKHHLDYKQSAIDNGIESLRLKYQGSTKGGASTLISLSTKEKEVPQRREKSPDPVTGKKVYEETGRIREEIKVVGTDPVTGKKIYEKTGKVFQKTTKTTYGADTDDMRTLSSGTKIEDIYADYSNSVKNLANQARKEAVNSQSIPYSPSAKKVYEKEVASLNAKLNTALKNAPKEREAQLLANYKIDAIKRANPDIDRDELKKRKGKALDEARSRVGASKKKVEITEREWEAIQAGAISGSKLKSILDNADMDKVKSLATPRQKTSLSQSKATKAKALLAKGYTQAEVAEALGVSVTTLLKSL